MKEALVLEIALNRIKLLRMLGDKGGIVLSAMEEVMLPVYADGKPSDEDIVEGIGYLHRKTGSKSKLVNCLIPGKRTLIKYDHLPPATGMKLNKIVQYEVESQIIINKDDAVYDYEVVRDAGGTKLLVVGCRNDAVNRHIKLVENTGLRVNSVEFSPGALFNAYMHNYESNGGLVLLIDIGPNETDLVVQEEGRFCSARSISGGTGVIIDALMENSDVSREEAEVIAEEEIDLTSGDGASGIVISELGKILREVDRYMKSLEKRNGFEHIDKILISGCGSVFPGLDEHIQGVTGIKTELLNPLRRVEVGPAAENAKFCPSSLATFIGAGLKELSDVKISINLLPEEKKEEITSRKNKAALLTSVVFMITILFTPFMHASLSRNHFSTRLQQAEKVSGKYEGYLLRISELSAQREMMLKKLSSLKSLRKRNVSCLENLSHISRLFPEGLYLDGFSVHLTPDNTIEHFVLSGSCSRYKEIEEIMDALSSSPLFSQARVVGITDSGNEASSDKLGFIIRLAPSEESGRVW